MGHVQAGDIFHKLDEIEQLEGASERSTNIVSIREKLQVRGVFGLPPRSL